MAATATPAATTAAGVVVPHTVKIIFLSGSLREASTNRGMIRALAKLVPASGVEVIYPNIRGLPFYDGDLESKGQPADVKTLWDQYSSADAVIISSPEYNGSFPAVLKNALDWLSRPIHGTPPLAGVPVAAISAAAGGGGEVKAAINKFTLRLKGIVVDFPDFKVQSYYVTPPNFSATGDLTNDAIIPHLQTVLDATIVAAKAHQTTKAAAVAAAVAATAAASTATKA